MNGQFMLHAHGHRGGIHHAQVHIDRVDVGKFVKFDRRRIDLGITVVHTIHFGGFDEHIRIDLHRAQGGSCVGGKVGVARTTAKDDHATFFKVPDGSPADVGFSNRAHFDRGHHPGHHIVVLEGIHQRQGVHHRAQHAHVIRGGLVHAHLQPGFPAPQVAGADHDGDIHAQFTHFLQTPGDVHRLLGINTDPGWACQ